VSRPCSQSAAAGLAFTVCFCEALGTLLPCMDVPLSGKATTLRDIRRVCGLGPLNSPEDLDKYWVNTDAARTTNFSLRNCIRKTLEDEHDTRILVYGHGGCGKSTELSKLIQGLGEAYFAVRFSIRNEMNLACVQAEDLLLVLTERLLQQAQEPTFRSATAPSNRSTSISPTSRAPQFTVGNRVWPHRPRRRSERAFSPPC